MKRNPRLSHHLPKQTRSSRYSSISRIREAEAVCFNIWLSSKGQPGINTTERSEVMLGLKLYLLLVPLTFLLWAWVILESDQSLFRKGMNHFVEHSVFNEFLHYGFYYYYYFFLISRFVIMFRFFLPFSIDFFFLSLSLHMYRSDVLTRAFKDSSHYNLRIPSYYLSKPNLSKHTVVLRIWNTGKGQPQNNKQTNILN